MEPKFAFFRQFTCLFLSWTMALAPFQASASYSLDHFKLIQTAADTDVPIDARDLHEYLQAENSSSIRDYALHKWFADHKSSKDFQQMLKQFWQEDPDTASRLEKANVGFRDIHQFFAETVLLMLIIKRDRQALIANQYEHWKHSWEKIDFRFMTPETAKVWSDKLRSIFGLALSEAGPWGEEDLKRVSVFFQSKVELNDKKWYSNFRSRLRRIAFNRYLTADPKIQKISASRATPGVYGGFPVGITTGAVYFYYSSQLIETLQLNTLPASIGTPLFMVHATSIVALGVGTWLGIAIGWQSTPLNFIRQRASLSDILAAGPLDCELLLEKEAAQ